MKLTTDQLIEILIEETTGREHQVEGPEADAFRQEVAKDIALAKEKGWAIHVPYEWNVKGADGNDGPQDNPDVQKGGPGSGCQGPTCGRPRLNMDRLIPTKTLRSHFGQNFRQDARSVERGWVLPNGNGIVLPTGKTHEGLLSEVGASPSQAFKAGWVRKVTPDSYNFDASNPTAQDAFRQDLAYHIEDLKAKNTPTIYIDDENRQYYFKLPIGVVESALDDRNSMDALLNPRWLGKYDSEEYNNIFKGGPGSGCQGPNCGRHGGIGTREELDIPLTPSRSVRVYKNPSPDDMASLVQSYRMAYPRAPQGEAKIRNTYDSKGNMYSWMSGDAVHSDIERGLTNLFPDSYNQNQVQKGGPGSGCHGATCGRPKTAVHDIRPAIQDANGKVFIGNKGENHYNVFERHQDEVTETENQNIRTGFVDKDGKWLSRTELDELIGIASSEELRGLQQTSQKFIKALMQKRLQKGGPGSGCQGPNCGRPKSVRVTVASQGLSIKSKYPKAFAFNHKDPVATKYANGETIDKFVVTSDDTFIPVLADQRHGPAMHDTLGTTGHGAYDASIRVVQDLPRKLAFIRLAHPSERVVNSAIIDGDERAMNQVLEYQRGVADKLYGNRKGMTIVLASGGSPRNDQNSLPNDLDNGYQLPDKPQSFVNPKFIYKT